MEAAGTLLKAFVGKRHGKEISERELGGTHTDANEATVRGSFLLRLPLPGQGLTSLPKADLAIPARLVKSPLSGPATGHSSAPQQGTHSWKVPFFLEDLF